MWSDEGRGRLRAGAGSLLFLGVAPGMVVGVVPWLLTEWRSGDSPYPAVLCVAGAGAVIGGSVVLLRAFLRFVVEGIGTPAPAAPTRRLVVGGLYRYVRNPMYLAVTSAIVGQALLLSRPALLLYAAVVSVANATFVRWYEEPTLHRQFGPEYEAYCEAVPAWLPRRTPWRGAGST